jgi:hypothetical protein
MNVSGCSWPAFDAIQHIRYGLDRPNNFISENTRILLDVPHGKPARATWVIPQFPYPDHAGPGATASGPDWVANAVNRAAAGV